MKLILSSPILLVCSLQLQAATSRVEDANNTTFVLSGTTTTVEGNNATFPGAAGARWTPTNGAVVGTDRVGTTVATPSNNDYYLNFGAAALGTIPVANNRYVEIHYSTSGDWSGTADGHALRLDTSNEPAEFVTFDNRGLIPSGSATGPQTIIIDLDVNGDFSGDWTTLRWDFFNDETNGGGKTFTIDKVIFANALTAVPEPSSLLLSALAIPFFFRRRR
jgi:hypothetical protein